MAIVNRRNAVVGWFVVKAGKEYMGAEGEAGCPGDGRGHAPAQQGGDRGRGRSPGQRAPHLAPRRRRERRWRHRGGMTEFFNRALADLVAYEPGKPFEEVQRELGLERVVKLSSNEGPFGPFPAALEA